MKLQKFDSEKEFINESSRYIKTSEKHIALSGGNTPKPIYQALSKEDLANKKFYQVDERYVPRDHPDSNYKMITETLKKPLHHFDTSLPIPEALEKYSKELPKEGFDLCILGIGPDGHTASLFPNSPALDSKNSVVHTQTTEFTITDRLSLSLATIMASKKLLILLKGTDKEQILEDLQNSPKTVKEFPAKALLDHPDLTIHFCTCQ